MIRTRAAAPTAELPRRENHPRYELRAVGLGRGDAQLEVWQVPSPATPRLREAERTAALKGRALRLIETRLAKRLRGLGITVPSLGKREERAFPLDEDAALQVSLLFRVLAPMRSPDRIRLVAEGVDRMTRDEAGYWLGMAVHRVYPRRVLAALRVLLTTP